MHPAITASSENSLCSAFAQFLAAASENKERCLGISPSQMFAIRASSDRGAMVDSLEREEHWYRTDAEKESQQHPSQTDRSRTRPAHPHGAGLRTRDGFSRWQSNPAPR